VVGPEVAERPRAGIILAGAALLLWPSILNWHPYLFWDTYGYFLQGEAYARLMLAAAGIGPPPAEVAQGWIGAAGRMLARDPAIRSPTWSLVTYGTAVAGSFWLLALTNALVAAATVELALVRLLGLPPATRLLVLAGMAAVTSLPWFASYLMPDLFAGLLVLAALLLVFAWSSLRPVERSGLIALYVAALTFHTSQLLLGILLPPLAALVPGTLAERSRRLVRLGLPCIAAAGLLVSVGWLCFEEPSATPHSPPFLLARAWEDGPARAYLAEACPAAGWAICTHLDRMAPTAQEFLWREEDSYFAMDLATRTAVRAEERPILLRALRIDPLGELRAALANAASQAIRIGLDDFVLGRGAAVTPTDYTFIYLPLAPAAAWGLSTFSAIVYGGAALALAVLATLWRRGRLTAREQQMVLFVLAALLLNAAICGALSGPHPRDQARVVWLLPLLAAALSLSARGMPAPRAA
jgi:hypothetical protein